MKNKILLMPITAFFIALSALASNTMTNLNTVQQLQRQQMFNTRSAMPSQTQSVGRTGGGYPILDATVLEQAKLVLFNDWQRKHNSDISFEEWKSTKLNSVLNER